MNTATTVPPEYFIRRAQGNDASDIMDLEIPEKTIQRVLFGRVHISALIETSYLSLTAENKNGNVIAFIAVNDQPPGDLAEESDYIEYIACNYGLDDIEYKVCFVVLMGYECFE